MFHGTSSALLRSILKEGLVPHKEKVWRSLGGVYLTTSVSRALSFARHAVKKFGGKRLIVVCRISFSHQPMDEDFIYETALSGIDPKKVLCQIRMGSFNFREYLRKLIGSWGVSIQRDCLNRVMSDKKNVKLLASLLVKYMAMRLSQEVEGAKEEREVIHLPCYPKLVFVYDGDFPVVTEDGYPVLRRSVEEWVSLYKKDLEKITNILGKCMSKVRILDQVSLRQERVGYRGSNRIIGIFQENPPIFEPVYVARGFDSYLKEFVSQIALYIDEDNPGIYKRIIHKLIDKKLSGG